MKKRLLLLPLLFLFVFSENVSGQCENPVGFETIRANKVKTGFPVNGDMFIDPERNPIFVVPYTPGLQEVNTFFAGALWMGAYDNEDSLKVAAQIRTQFSNKTDYWPGPIDEASAEVLMNGCINFDRVWKVNRGEILMLIADYEDNGQIDNPVSLRLFSWPAMGNPHFEPIMGFPLPEQELAPFFDRNENGIYEPLNGEYPVIDTGLPLVIPDEMLWCVFNDLKPEHTGSGGSPLGVEVHLLVYAFNCNENEVLNHSIFTRHKIINKSGSDLFDFRMGLWNNGDLGCYQDDFFGTDTLLNSVYYYNEFNTDGFNSSYCASFSTMYGENPPVQALTFLNQKLSKLTYYATLISESPPAQLFLPANDTEFYNFLSGKWRDGTPLTYGGNGYDTASNNFVNHAYFENPNLPDSWSFYSLGPGYYDVSATIASIGPFNLFPGESITLDAAYSFHRAPGADHLENVNVALENIPSIQAIYDSGFSSGCTQFQFCESDCIWPGDANADGIAKEDDLLYLAIGISQGNTGPQRTPPSIIWSPQPGEDWGVNFFDGKEFKHADFNGDGKLDSLDGFVLDLNFYEKQPGFVASQVEAPQKEGELFVDISRQALSTQDSYFKRYTRATVKIATDTSTFQPLSGISFVVEFDTSFFKKPVANFPPGETLPMITPFVQTFLGDTSEVMTVLKAFPEIGQFAVGIARKDGMPVAPVHGNIITVAMVFRDDAIISSPQDYEFIKLKVYDTYGANANGEIIEIGVSYDSMLITNLDTIPTAVTDRFSEKLSVDIFPNPNAGTFQISISEHSHMLEFSIHDLFGKTVWRGEIPPGQTSQELILKNHLRKGIYFLKVLDKDGRFITKKLIVKEPGD